MKTAYELAMERLKKNRPSVRLTDAQKKEIAEIESQFKAKVAEREVVLGDRILKARMAGDMEEAEKLQEELARERKKLEEEAEARKEKVRGA